MTYSLFGFLLFVENDRARQPGLRATDQFQLPTSRTSPPSSSGSSSSTTRQTPSDREIDRVAGQRSSFIVQRHNNLACVCDRPILTDGFSPSSLACEGQQWFGPCRSDLPQQNLNIRPGGRWSYTETSIRSQTIATVLQAPTWRSLIPSVSQQLDLAPGVDHVASLPSQILNLTVKISTELSKRGDNGRRERESVGSSRP